MSYKLLKTIIAFLFIVAFSHSFCMASNSEIQKMNDIVKQIQTNRNQYKKLEIKLHEVELEGVPPELIFFYDNETEQAKILEVTVGHEIFSIQFIYYFHNDKVIKYIKQYDGHPENPPKEAIIYNLQGDILWKNTDKVVISPNKIQLLFKDIMKTLKEFNTY